MHRNGFTATHRALVDIHLPVGEVGHVLERVDANDHWTWHLFNESCIEIKLTHRIPVEIYLSIYFKISRVYISSVVLW